MALQDPGKFREFSCWPGGCRAARALMRLMFGAAATVAFSVVVQIGEQVDYLRFPAPEDAREPLALVGAVLVAGPGWILPGMLKMLGGPFSAFLVLQ